MSAPARPEPVAIVGIGCRFPGADGPEEFWRLLREGRDVIAEVPASRFDIDAVFHPRPAVPGRIVTRLGGFLDRVERFDAGFFGISPREAARMDPQQRLLLEVAWEALEDAGQLPERLADLAAGVFVGMCYNDYEDLQLDDPESYGIYGVVGGFRSVAAGRVSRALGLSGPSFSVDAACASSLVAVHLACQSLWSGECEVALACGSNLILEPQVSIGFSQARMLAPDGRCKFADARADGFVRSEGVGVVVLEPASRARAQGDRVYATVVGSASNNDGASGGSMMTPGRPGQAQLLRRAYRRAGIAPCEIDYVEAHGTGTPVGDPVEIGALADVLGEGRPADRPLLVGSVKSNLGHTEGAAGIAGLIKLALCLDRGEIPPSLHVREPNPAIPWSELPVSVVRRLEPWPRGEKPRRAGVSSFGINGSNAHVVLAEAAPGPAAARSARGPHLLALSAKTPAALARLARSWSELLRRPEAPPLADLCWTAALRRTHHRHRLAAVGAGAEDLAERLEAFAAGEARQGLASGDAPERAPRVAFVFPGQGSQWLGMGRELLAAEPVFRAALEACDQHIREETGWSLLAQLMADEATSRLDQVDVVQPALFAVQVALAALWRSRGIEPAAVIGQSLGEVAAATVAGALSLADGVRVICRRSRLVKTTSGHGGMAVVELSMAEAREALRGREAALSVAVSSAPRSTVISGDSQALDELLADLEARGTFGRRINVDYASHSPQMDPLRDELLAVLQEVHPRAAEVPVYSTVEAAPTDGASFDARYWVRNLREPVLFAAALERLLADGCDALIEISAHPVVTVAVEQALADWGARALVLPSARREQEAEVMLSSLGALHAAGAPVAWERLHPQGGRVVPLPAYPWQHESYWLERRAAGRRAMAGGAGGTTLFARRLRSALPPGADLWEAELDLAAFPELRDHRVSGAVVLPAAATLTLALEAAGSTLSAIRFDKGVFLDEEAPVTLQLAVSQGTFQAFLREGEEWVPFAQGSVEPRRQPPVQADLAAARTRCPEEVAGERLYCELAERGLDYGPAFRPVERMWRGEGEAVGAVAAAGSWPIAVLDACFQLVAALLPPDAETCLPVSLDRLEVPGDPVRGSLCHARLTPAGEGFSGDATLFDDQGEVVLVAEGLRLQRLDVPASVADHWFFGLEWEPSSRPLSRRLDGEEWLVLADRGGVGEELAVCLEARGARTTLAALGELLPLAPGRFAGVVHLRSLAADASLSAVELIRALAAAGGPPPRLCFVTQGAQAVEAGDGARLALGQAPLWGLARTAVYEHPELRCRLIDWGSGVPVRSLADEIAAETAESEAALRGSSRLVARWSPRPPGRSRIAIRSDRSYLITGGLGGLGLEVARWLAESGARHLVLLGRRVTGGEAVAALEAAGAAVRLEAADVADPAAMARVFADLERELPPLAGVVHAAGLLADKTLAELDGDLLEAVARPKVRGGWVLHELTREMDLDFFVLFSSLASLLGSPGQGNYSAANAFLDALAHHRRARGLPALAVNWGPWSEVGLAASAARGGRLARRGVASLTPRQGIAALERVLGGGDAQIAVVPFSIGQWRGFYPVAEKLPLFSRMDEARGSATTAAALRERLLAAPPEQRTDHLESYLRDTLARTLGLAAAKVERDRPITKLGLDSLMAVEMRNRIEADLGARVAMVGLLKGPSLAELAEQLAADLPSGTGQAQPTAADVEALDEAALDALLAELLEQEEAAP